MRSKKKNNKWNSSNIFLQDGTDITILGNELNSVTRFNSNWNYIGFQKVVSTG